MGKQASSVLETKDGTTEAERTSASSVHSPEEILQQFQEASGIECDLVNSGTVIDVTEHVLKLRVDRKITAKERRKSRTVSYPSYYGRLIGRVPYDQRYRKAPEKVFELREQLSNPSLDWVDGQETISTEYRENSGRSPYQCRRCEGSGQMSCGDCNLKGKEPCPRCSDSGSKRGHVKCSHCSGSGKINCSKCNGSGKVRNDDWQKVMCPKCRGDARWRCEYCNGDGYQRCPNHCNNGKITCRTCNGSNEVDCGPCDTSGKVVSVKEGEINYTFSQAIYSDEDSTVDPSLLLATEMECTSVEGETHDMPTADDLQEEDSSEPRNQPYTVADVSLLLEASMAQIKYSYGGKKFELYKVGDLMFYNELPMSNQKRVKNLIYVTWGCILIGATLALLGPRIVGFFQGVVV